MSSARMAAILSGGDEFIHCLSYTVCYLESRLIGTSLVANGTNPLPEPMCISYQFQLSTDRRQAIDTLRMRQNGRHCPDTIFKCIFLSENVWIVIKISLKFVPKVQINNSSALVQIMAWWRPGDKPLSGLTMVGLHIYASPGLNGLMTWASADQEDWLQWPLLLTWINFNPSMDK